MDRVRFPGRTAARGRRDRVRPHASHFSSWYRTPQIASSDIAPEAPLWISGPAQAVSVRRPLRRRLDTIARPARVLIRSRNPCTRARRRLFGWNVRLPLATALSPHASGTSSTAHRPTTHAEADALPLVSSSRSLTGAGPVKPIPRFAAVSPTFGRLFEGTELHTLGQTAFVRHHLITAVTTVTAVKRHADKYSAMWPKGGHASGNLLASASAVSARSGLRQAAHNEVRVPGSVPDTSRARGPSARRPSLPAERQPKRGAVLSTSVDNYCGQLVIVSFVDRRQKPKGGSRR